MKNIYEKPIINFWKAEVLNKIEASMSGGGGIDTEIGSSRWNPYNLTSGQIGTLSLADCWFECEIDGAVDFQITANTEFNVKVYRNNCAPYNLFREWTSQNCKINECVSVHNVNDEINKYMVNVTSNSNITVVCRIKQHVDCVEDDAKKGGIWVPNEDSAHAYASNGIENSIWYLQKETVENFIMLLEHEKANDLFMSAEDIMKEQGAELTLDALEEGLSVLEDLYPFMTILKNVPEAIYVQYRGKFKFYNNVTLYFTLKEKSEYNSETKKCAKGVLVAKNYIPPDVGIFIAFAEEWDGTTMYGEPGWTGNFDTDYYKLKTRV